MMVVVPETSLPPIVMTEIYQRVATIFISFKFFQIVWYDQRLIYSPAKLAPNPAS